VFGAAGLVARAEVRRRRGSLLLLVVIVATVTAAVLATVAGARRTSTVLDRFSAATAARDLHVAVLSPEFALDPGRVDGLRQKLADLEGVTTAAAITVAPVGAKGTQYDFGIMTSPDGGYFVDVDRPIVLAGRLPRPDAVDEIAVNETAVDQLDLSVGDVFRGPTFTAAETAAFLADEAVSEAASGPTVSAKVVGIVRQGDELAIRPQSLNPGGIASPAFFRANAERIGFSVSLYALRIDRTVVRLEDVLAHVREDVGTEYETFASYVEDDYAGEAGDAFRTLSSGLLVVAAIALVVGLLTVLQAVNRHLALSSESESTLQAIGLGRWGRIAGFGGPCAVAVVAGAVAGLAGAVGLSRWFPPSLARRAEVSPGFDADWFVLVPCGVAVTAVLLLIVAWRAHRAASRGGASATASWPARVGSAVRFTGPAATVGVTMALDPGRGRRSVPARSALLGALTGVAGVVAAFVFVGSVAAGRDEPARYGWTWDTQPDLVVEDPEAVVSRMVDDPDLAAIAAVSCAPLTVDDIALYACAFEDWKGSTGSPVTAGRPPAGPNEVALGRITMERLGLSMGETFRTTSGDSLTVVGQAVIPMLDNAEPGQGAVLTDGGLTAHQDTGGGRYLLLTYQDGTDVAALEQRLSEEYGVTFTRYSAPQAPGRLLQLAAMTGWLVALGVFLAGLGVLGLVHFLAVSVRRRRVDFAVLQSLGFVRRDVGLSVSCQAVTVALLGVLAGVPLGIVIGRWAWLAAIRSAGMLDTPAVDVGWLLLVTVAAVGGGAVIGAVPGWFAGRRPPAEGLRSE
jgi:FtsX-like permease family protein